jgi:hypothetical protein
VGGQRGRRRRGGGASEMTIYLGKPELVFFLLHFSKIENWNWTKKLRNAKIFFSCLRVRGTVSFFLSFQFFWSYFGSCSGFFIRSHFHLWERATQLGRGREGGAGDRRQSTATKGSQQCG